MTPELLLSVIVPACVLVLMFGVGLNLDLVSFGQTLRQPRDLLVATLLQILFLPALALLLIAVFEPAPLVALALVAIAASPGGALSNAFTQYVGGNLAFSVAMTTVSTLLAPATAAAVVAAALACGALERGAAAPLDPARVTIDLLRLALLPIGLGLLVAHLLPRAAAVLRPAAARLGVAAIAAVLVASAMVSLPALHQGGPAPLVFGFLFSLGSLILGLLAAAAVPREKRSACFVEFGLRNLPVALMLAGGAAPSSELVAFLFCYFLVNATTLAAVSLMARAGVGRVPA